MTNTDFKQFESFFNDKNFQELLYKVEEDRKKFENSHFNLFSLVSDQYRKENLHSDILAEFLNPKGGHGQGNIFLMEFIKIINFKAEKQKGERWRGISNINLNLDNFKDSKVIREQGRIDILITGVNEAIIFENKINNAGDTRRQLPDYFNLIKSRIKDGKEEFDNIVIVYMPYISNKLPEENGWEDGDQDEIYSRLVLFNAFDAKNEGLLKGLIKRWLELKSISCRNKFILEEYSELLKIIGGQTMNHSEDIKDFLLKDENLDNLVRLQSFINEIPRNLMHFAEVELNDLAKSIGEKYFYDPKNLSFQAQNINIEKNKFRVVFQAEMTQSTSGKFMIRFWDENYDQNEDPLKYVKPIIDKLNGKFKEFECNSANDEMHLIFKAPNKIKDFISTSKCLLEDLKRIADNQKQNS